ncbi:hypothetical protein DAPPUDRAFT_309965 [Daphnia pulex]|uniref:Uncharacterized protein n=1 Tax=Daphnia pulex TaxID=6669 RepID=E9FRA6_DAPPU|nr:hypothetical protein DAPPUDRAFT_320100 [Daphnia pulex]EFX90130.1 hypothetical protein DAPPUDRAFT_309965 [Daphnia pulex]|eukprot:EFX78820.1 hypothetical protein DAPPUDRAFT_320100 [Daphnia pulex]
MSTKHCYETEKIFLALKITVKSHNNLLPIVKTPVEEMVKCMCIKTIPYSTLVIQLKHYYSLSLGCRKVTQFPWELDMAPYTSEGIQQRERTDSPG